MALRRPLRSLVRHWAGVGAGRGAGPSGAGPGGGEPAGASALDSGRDRDMLRGGCGKPVSLSGRDRDVLQPRDGAAASRGGLCLASAELRQDRLDQWKASEDALRPGSAAPPKKQQQQRMLRGNAPASKETRKLGVVGSTREIPVPMQRPNNECFLAAPALAPTTNLRVVSSSLPARWYSPAAAVCSRPSNGACIVSPQSARCYSAEAAVTATADPSRTSEAHVLVGQALARHVAPQRWALRSMLEESESDEDVERALRLLAQVRLQNCALRGQLSSFSQAVTEAAVAACIRIGNVEKALRVLHLRNPYGLAFSAAAAGDVLRYASSQGTAPAIHATLKRMRAAGHKLTAEHADLGVSGFIAAGDIAAGVALTKEAQGQGLVLKLSLADVQSLGPSRPDDVHNPES